MDAIPTPVKTVAIILLMAGGIFAFVHFDRESGYQKLTRKMYKTYGKGDLLASEQVARARIKYVEDEYSGDSKRMTQAIHDLAFVYNASGQSVKAIVFLTKAVKEAEEQFGPNSRRVGIYLDNLGIAYSKMGRYAEARKHSKRAHDIFMDVIGEGGRDTVIAKLNLSNIEIAIKKHSNALWWAKEALTVAQERYEGSPLHAKALQQVGLTLVINGRSEQAPSILQKAMEVIDSNVLNNTELGQVYQTQAIALGMLGHPAAHDYQQKANRLLKRGFLSSPV